MWTIVLLTISNIFMTFAWYGHLRFRHEALWKVILVSWGIAFFEYCFQVPANRIGADRFSPVISGSICAGTTRSPRSS
jgi:hypothetical protein